MVAVLGMDRDPLAQICREASSLGVVEIANYNCPGQLVIGGETAAVEKAAELALERKAKTGSSLAGERSVPYLSDGSSCTRIVPSFAIGTTVIPCKSQLFLMLQPVH